MEFFPWYIVRENTVSFNQLQFLYDNKIVASINEYNQAKDNLKKVSQETVIELESIFSKTKNNRILNIKRKIFNLKKVDFHSIPEEVENETQDYVKAYNEIENHQKYLVNLIKRMDLEHQNKIWDIYKKSSLIKNPLPLVNYNIIYKLQKYLNTEPKNQSKKTKKINGTLLNIITRSTYKTSPFSSFTSIDIKQFRKKEENTKGYDYKIEINYFILQKIIELISMDKEILPNLSFYYNGNKINENQIDFIKRYDINRGKIHKNIEKKFSLTNSSLLDDLEKQKQPMNYLDLLNLLKNYIPQYNIENVAYEFIKKGIVETDFILNEYVPNVLDEFYKVLNSIRHQSSKVNIILKYVKELEIKMSEYELSSYEERFEIYKEMVGILREIGSILDYNFIEENIFYEDYLVNSSEKHLEIDQSLKDSLDSVQKLSLILSIPIQFKFEFANRFNEIYGNGIIGINNHEVRDLFTKEVAKFDNWSQVLKPLNNLKSSKARLIEEIKKEIKEYINDKKNEEEISIDSKQVNIWFYKIFHDFRLEVISSTALIQKSKNGYVLNKLYAGNLKLFIRYFKYIKSIYNDRDFRHYIKNLYPENTYEVRENFGFNANHHEPFISKMISSLPTSKDNLSYFDIYYKYNNENKMLDVVTEEQQKVTIDYIGSLVDYMLPPTIRMATTTISPRFDASFFDVWNENTKKQKREHFLIETIPRMNLGSLTISRKKWLISSQNVKMDYKSLEEWYIELINCFNENNIPLEFFIKKQINFNEINPIELRKTDTKPQYINLNSPLYIKIIYTMFKTGVIFVIEEFYPEKTNFDENTEFQIEMRNNYE